MILALASGCFPQIFQMISESHSMSKTSSAERMRIKRERDRASNVVRVEERLPRDKVEQLKQFAAELRKNESQNEGGST